MKIFTKEILSGFNDAFEALTNKMENHVQDTLQRYKTDILDDHEKQFKRAAMDQVDIKTKGEEENLNTFKKQQIQSNSAVKY